MYKVIFSDFDGTLTHKGKITPDFLEIIKLVRANHSRLVIVSGRSISWGHFLLTHFDIDCCIMEGGGVVLTKNGKDIIAEMMVSSSEITKLEEEATLFTKNLPDIKLSDDSFGRKTDRAVEFFTYGENEKRRVVEYLKTRSVPFYTSNVHLNFWIGDVSKSKASLYYLEKHCKFVNVDECIFFGDAINDESMFELFPNSVGVSNITSFWNQLKHKPKVRLMGLENEASAGVLNYLTGIYQSAK